MTQIQQTLTIALVALILASLFVATITTASAVPVFGQTLSNEAIVDVESGQVLGYYSLEVLALPQERAGNTEQPTIEEINEVRVDKIDLLYSQAKLEQRLNPDVNSEAYTKQEIVVLMEEGVEECKSSLLESGFWTDEEAYTFCLSIQTGLLDIATNSTKLEEWNNSEWVEQ